METLHINEKLKIVSDAVVSFGAEIGMNLHINEVTYIIDYVEKAPDVITLRLIKALDQSLDAVRTDELDRETSKSISDLLHSYRTAILSKSKSH